MTIEQHASTNCFLCGTENKKGLKLKWFTDDFNQTVYSDMVISDEYCGYFGVVHGGIVAAIMDETAGRTTLLANPDGLQEGFVTKKLEVEFIKPTPTNTPLRAIGRIEAIKGRHFSINVELILLDGTETARSKAIIVVSPQQLDLLIR